jgi:hypothetical protein
MPNMDDSVSVMPPADKPWLFQHGNTEYRARQARLDERFSQLCAEYEDTPAQRQILRAVAANLDDAERSRIKWKRTRAANTAQRLLRSIPRKQPPALTLEEMLADTGEVTNG